MRRCHIIGEYGNEIEESFTKMKSNSFYECENCDEKFIKKFDFFEHKNIHSNETPFMCVSCRKCFKFIKEYIDHIKSRHNVHEKSDFQKKNQNNQKKCNCCSCLIIFKKLVQRNTFKCENCNKNFATAENLSKHECLVSSTSESFRCSCSQTFVKASAFKSHVGSKPYSCCSCSMRFNIIANLIRHIRTHTKEKPFVCKVCGRGFSQSSNLRNHSSIHLGSRAIKCNQCDFSCKTLNGLKKHKKKHLEGLNNQNYIDGRKKSTNKSVCPICNKQFLFKRNMAMHMKIHTNKELLCTKCGKVFDVKGKLSSHYKACHTAPSICNTCGKLFASAILLNSHEKTHVSEKSFSCDICQKTFTIKNYLNQHLKTHSNEKQFSCSKCGKLFKVSRSLKYHNNICISFNTAV